MLNLASRSLATLDVYSSNQILIIFLGKLAWENDAFLVYRPSKELAFSKKGVLYPLD